MADFAHPKKDDPDVQKAVRAHPIARNLKIREQVPDSNHKHGAKACSMFNAERKPIPPTFVEFCRDQKGVTVEPFIKKDHLKQAPLPPVPKKSK